MTRVLFWLVESVCSVTSINRVIFSFFWFIQENRVVISQILIQFCNSLHSSLWERSFYLRDRLYLSFDLVFLGTDLYNGITISVINLYVSQSMADHVRYISSIPPYIYVILREEPYGPHSLNNSSSNKTVLHLLKMISSAAPVAKAAVCHSTFGSLHFRDSRNIKKMTSSWESASLPWWHGKDFFDQLQPLFQICL